MEVNKKTLVSLFGEAVRVSMPGKTLPKHLPKQPKNPKGEVFVVAIGKAAAEMSYYAERKYKNVSGIALTRYNHKRECKWVEVVEAAHPVPDDKGLRYTKKITKKVSGLGKDDLVLFLVSGGGSALFTKPRGVSFTKKRKINQALLNSGATIKQMNIVRKHVSGVKGGRFAEIAKNTNIVTLAISDVPNDEPTTIASGPTVPDPSTSKDAIHILKSLGGVGVNVDDKVIQYLKSPKSETPKKGDKIFAGNSFQVVANADMMIRHITKYIVKKTGKKVVSLGANVEGEAAEVAKKHANIARKNKGKFVVSGGETTVTVDKGKSGGKSSKRGKGGRNCEYLLSLAIETEGENIYAIAADTDGIDGNQNNAGAVVTPTTIKRAKKMGMNPKNYLESHDSFTFFQKLGDLVVTGPTRTNVNDFRAILINRTGDSSRRKNRTGSSIQSRGRRRAS